MPMRLKTRRVEIAASSHLELSPDPDAPQRYLVRFCGLDRDRAAHAATEHARVRLLLASLRGQAPHPYPLPSRVIIGTIDAGGWHCGRSAYAQALADMPAVRSCIDELLADLMLRVALVAAAEVPADSQRSPGDASD
jgi:hypothetical protein